MNFAKFSLGAFALSAMLVACDSDSASAKDTEIEELSSSSVIANEVTQSSSSEETQSSSSEIASSSSSHRNDSSSSSAMETSSSSAIEIASSSSTIRNDSLSSSAIESSSSSVVEIASSSSTIRNDNSSSSSKTTQSSSSFENTSAGSIYDATAKTLKDLRDGKSYKTVIIGTQTWMAENLNYADSVTTTSLKGKSWCYNDVAANCDVGGRLYTWTAAIDSVKLATDADNPLDCGYGKTCGLSGKVQGICPEDWHLPSTTEWNTLFTAVGGSSTAGAKLKSQTGWTAHDGITNEDSFGFSALPAGGRNFNGYYHDEGYHANFWSSTELDSDGAYRMSLDYDNDDADLYGNLKDGGHSVRCLKD